MKNNICFLVFLFFSFCFTLKFDVKLADKHTQQVFAIRDGWLGADVGTSLKLNNNNNNNTFLWLWGDTLVGTVNTNGTRNFKTMPRNSSKNQRGFFNCNFCKSFHIHVVGIMKPTNQKVSKIDFYIKFVCFFDIFVICITLKR
jgi:hypothetical protein